jgi:hypothetical protein
VDTTRSTWLKRGSARDELTGRVVHALAFDEERERLYVCTSGGVTILSLPEHRIVGRVTADDGLPSDSVRGARLQGRTLILCCAVSGGDETSGDRLGASPAAVDLPTGLVQRLSKADGIALGSDLPESSAVFNRRGQLLEPGEEEEWEALPPEKTLPFLGGPRTVDVEHDGQRYLGGPNGLVILTAPERPLKWDMPLRTVKGASRGRPAGRRRQFGQRGRAASRLAAPRR